MGCPRKLFPLIALLANCALANAGVETPLLVEIQRECTVRVVHDATPDSTTGTLLFRAFRVVDGVSVPCDLAAAEVAASLGRGVAAYRAHDALKPAESVFVGRLSRYPWIREAWERESGADLRNRLDADAFNALVGSGDIARPFSDALRVNGLEPGGASCEKLMFYDNGAPLDALCWFLIEKH